VQLEGLGKLKKSNNLIGIRTRDLAACSIVPEEDKRKHNTKASRSSQLD
jgi:hypothetical protein